MPVNSLIRITIAYDKFKPVLLNQERFQREIKMKPQ